MTSGELVLLVGRLLGKSDTWNPSTIRVEPLAPDGSSRRFYRLREERDQSLIAILPPENDERGQAEARSFFHIGTHLHGIGAPTPNIFAFDTASGLALCEDLGEDRLHERVKVNGLAATLPLYEQAVLGLARMQVRGANNFDPAWCWDTPKYDQQVMLVRESGYFLRACCMDLLRLDFDQDAVARECRQLAEAAAQAPAHYFLHRDFQSRNIMVCGGEVRFIDFQGGRLGPLGYDLASLLIDPYTGLTPEIQAYLQALYLHTVREEIPYDTQQFYQEYLLLAVQRNLQILGAFAFLSQVRHKPFFTQFLRPALDSLGALLAKPEAAGYGALQTLCQRCRHELERLYE